MTASSEIRLSSLAAVLSLAACANTPTGPTVPVMPGTGKSFEQFRADDGKCQQFAMSEVFPASSEKARPSAAGTAGTGAMAPGYAMQRKYDFSYIQCMYASGHRVPVLGAMAVQPPLATGQSPPPPSDTPPGMPR